jgi:hypothetical protein
MGLGCVPCFELSDSENSRRYLGLAVKGTKGLCSSSCFFLCLSLTEATRQKPSASDAIKSIYLRKFLVCVAAAVIATETGVGSFSQRVVNRAVWSMAVSRPWIAFYGQREYSGVIRSDSSKQGMPRRPALPNHLFHVRSLRMVFQRANIEYMLLVAYLCLT